MVDIEYNTQRPRLIISEYGRNVQKMIDFASTIEDRDERNKVAEAIINVMGQLKPQLRDAEEFRHKLWTHLFLMSDFKLDVDSPYPIPTAETFESKPDRVPYPQTKIKVGHYGKTIPKFIAKCRELEDSKEKEAFALSIGNLMKKAYLEWNRSSVSDELIVDHLKSMSNGELIIKDPSILMTAKELAVEPNKSEGFKKKNNNNNNKYKKNNNNKYKKRY